jgi:hypothetical protein
MGCRLKVIQWQIKRYWVTGFILIILLYLAWSSINEIHLFKYSSFVANVVFESIVMGFIGSFFFLAFLFSLKPNIKIADKICYNPDKNMYYFKMVNMALFFSIKDVSITIDHCRLAGAIGDGYNVFKKRIHLSNNSFTHVDSILSGKENKVYAFIVQSNGTVIDSNETVIDSNETNKNKPSITTILNDMEYDYIELSVYARHSLSGFSIQKSKIYKNHHHIETGEYATGINVEILSCNT